ncbi:MAG: MBL fold metallo-hydrolase [Elusimicrobiales bacterium]|nr:MBL fold metallo-hydrolase [Elusimicrobiales bacterium]
MKFLFLFILLNITGAKIVDEILNSIKWPGYPSLLLKIDEKNIYIDPWKLKDVTKKVDIILVNNSHFDR